MIKNKKMIELMKSLGYKYPFPEGYSWSDVATSVNYHYIFRCGGYYCISSGDYRIYIDEQNRLLQIGYWSKKKEDLHNLRLNLTEFLYSFKMYIVSRRHMISLDWYLSNLKEVIMHQWIEYYEKVQKCNGVKWFYNKYLLPKIDDYIAKILKEVRE